jgi:hypothetical protein
MVIGDSVMEEYKVVHCHIYKPHNSIFKSSRNNKAEVQTVDCCNSDKCGLFHRKECSFVSVFGWHKCPYGRYSKYEGFTRNARKYSEWIKEQETKYAGITYLNSHSTVMAIVGEYIFLPYPHMTMNGVIPFLGKESLFVNGNGFLKLENFTVDTIIKMVEFKPQALMGGEIKSYQKEVLPKFLKHLSEQMPELFQQVIEKSEKAKEQYRTFTNVGRRAILETVTPNVGQFKDIHGGLWTWDGKTLKSNNSKASFMLVSAFKELAIVPEEKQTVTITDEGQVGDKTIFVN